MIDVASRSVVDEVAVGSKPLIPAASPDGRSVYVGNSGDGTVSAIDPAGRTVTATFDVGGSPIGIGFSPDGGLLYVADNAAGELAVLDRSAGTVGDRLAVGSKPVALAVAPPAGGTPAGSSASLTETGGPRIGGYFLPGPGVWVAAAVVAVLGAALAVRQIVGSPSERRER